MKYDNKSFNRLKLYFVIAAIMIVTPTLLGLYSGQTGRLLVATEKMNGDQFFSQKVVYIFDHSFWGANGIIINQPLMSKEPKEFGIHYHNAHLYNGGPVAFPSLKTVSIKRPKKASKWRIQPLTVVDYKRFEDSYPSYAEENTELNVYIGYSGWNIGQLENEIKNGMWVVIDCNINKINQIVPNSELWNYFSKKDKKNLCP